MTNHFAGMIEGGYVAHAADGTILGESNNPARLIDAMVWWAFDHPLTSKFMYVTSKTGCGTVAEVVVVDSCGHSDAQYVEVAMAPDGVVYRYFRDFEYLRCVRTGRKVECSR